MHLSPLPVPDRPLPPDLAPWLVALAAGLAPVLPLTVQVTFHLLPPALWPAVGVGERSVRPPLLARAGSLSFVPAPDLDGAGSPLLLVDRPGGLELQRIDSEQALALHRFFATLHPAVQQAPRLDVGDVVGQAQRVRQDWQRQLLGLRALGGGLLLLALVLVGMTGSALLVWPALALTLWAWFTHPRRVPRGTLERRLLAAGVPIRAPGVSQNRTSRVAPASMPAEPELPGVVKLRGELEAALTRARHSGSPRAVFDAREALERYLPETVALYRALPAAERDPAALDLALRHIRQIGAGENLGAARWAWDTQRRFLADRAGVQVDGSELVLAEGAGQSKSCPPNV